jgi:hypothetical protein
MSMEPLIRYDERKPFKTGGGSHVITIHPDWIQKYKKHKGPFPILFDNFYIICPPDTTPEERWEVEKVLRKLEEIRARRRRK